VERETGVRGRGANSTHLLPASASTGRGFSALTRSTVRCGGTAGQPVVAAVRSDTRVARQLAARVQLGRRPDSPPVRLGREAGWPTASAAVLGAGPMEGEDVVMEDEDVGRLQRPGLRFGLPDHQTKGWSSTGLANLVRVV
jgi:hypothetical protein